MPTDDECKKEQAFHLLVLACRGVVLPPVVLVWNEGETHIRATMWVTKCDNATEDSDEIRERQKGHHRTTTTEIPTRAVATTTATTTTTTTATTATKTNTTTTTTTTSTSTSTSTTTTTTRTNILCSCFSCFVWFLQLFKRLFPLIFRSFFRSFIH